MIHPWISFSLEGPAPKLCRVDIHWEDNTEYYFRISIGGSWSDVFYGKSKGNPSVVEKYEFAEQACKFVKITILEGQRSMLPECRAHIKEIALYGKAL